eukprot:15464046-Alexandrium_andersonii.AAC.1
MMTQCPKHFPLEHGEAGEPCDDRRCILRHDACKFAPGPTGMGQQHKRRGTSLVPSELCHRMNPCTDRKATLTSEGMCWSGTGGAYRVGWSTAPRQGVDDRRATSRTTKGRWLAWVRCGNEAGALVCLLGGWARGVRESAHLLGFLGN